MLTSDTDILNKLCEGDEAAFKSVYNKYVPKLYHFIKEYIPHNDIAENIVQDTMMTLWNKRSELQANSNLSSFLFTIAKNNCLYRLRDQRYLKKHFADLDFLSPEIKANAEALSVLDTSAITFEEIERIIEMTINQLPPQCRNVFESSRYRNKKNKEIADELGISVKAVEGHITKSLKILRENLKDYLPLAIYLIIR